MKYLDNFVLPNMQREERLTEMPTVYPFGLFSRKDFTHVFFDSITIFYGSNGSGKSTLLNIISEKLKIKRKTFFYEDEQFKAYIKGCEYKMCLDDDDKEYTIPIKSKIITSEDIFEKIVSIRKENNRIDERRSECQTLYQQAKRSKYQFTGMQDYDKLKTRNDSLRKTQTSFVRDRVGTNIRQYSNGENVLKYFDEQLEDDGLYLLDEPENCLSPEFQVELVKLIREATRYCGCQFIIATHSPFILSIPEAKIYDLDLELIDTCRWTELPNVRFYYDFFKSHKDEFD